MHHNIHAYVQPCAYSPLTPQSDFWRLKEKGDFLPYNTLNCAGASQDFTVMALLCGDGGGGGGGDG